MALTNPTKYVSVQRLQRFETKLAAKYQTQAIAAITGLTAQTVEAALAELLGKIQAVPTAIVPKGTKTFAQLAPSTDLAAGSLGYMWNISDAFTTTADFAEGAGHSIPAGANVYVANVGTAAEPVYKYEVEIARIYRGTIFSVFTGKVSGNYIWASYGGKTGWVDKRYIEYC